METYTANEFIQKEILSDFVCKISHAFTRYKPMDKVE